MCRCLKKKGGDIHVQVLYGTTCRRSRCVDISVCARACLLPRQYPPSLSRLCNRQLADASDRVLDDMRNLCKLQNVQCICALSFICLASVSLCVVAHSLGQQANYRKAAWKGDTYVVCSVSSFYLIQFSGRQPKNVEIVNYDLLTFLVNIYFAAHIGTNCSR